MNSKKATESSFNFLSEACLRYIHQRPHRSIMAVAGAPNCDPFSIRNVLSLLAWKHQSRISYPAIGKEFYGLPDKRNWRYSVNRKSAKVRSWNRRKQQLCRGTTETGDLADTSNTEPIHLPAGKRESKMDANQRHRWHLPHLQHRARSQVFLVPLSNCAACLCILPLQWCEDLIDS